MLDFYYIEEERVFPEEPDEDNYINSFNLDEFKLLEKLIQYGKEKEIQLIFFDDSRLSKMDILILFDFCKTLISNLKEDSTKEVYLKMYNVLDSSIKANKEIICFCD
ncbi:MAG: hypothetical protein HRT73_10455 [Flavobacteriales bacterium]|nr:hypothetical protein [Flavobacteriales bacterium]